MSTISAIIKGKWNFALKASAFYFSVVAVIPFIRLRLKV